MLVRRILAVALTATALLATRRAHAWQEAHQIGDDVRVRIDPGGMAQVEHRLRWHVLRGPLKTIELVHVEGSASVDPDVPITAEDGRALLAHAARRDDRTVRITIDEPRALMRGNFTFDVRWHVDLAASRALVRDGATWRLTWSAPVATDGFDAARSVFELPAAPDPPQPIVADTGIVDDAAVAQLTREADTDVLEVVRPHVARGEVPVWTLRIDPRALPKVVDARLRPPSEAKPPPEPDRVQEAALVAGLGAIALAFGWIVHQKSGRFAAACAARGATPRALIPLPDAARAVLAGAALATAVGLEIGGWATAGAATVVVAMLAAALRAPTVKPPARGPGRWLALRPDDAFAAAPSSWAVEALAVVVVSALVAAVATASRRFDAEGPWLVTMDAMALVPLFATGRASQLPPDGARAPARWLARAFRILRAVPGLRVSPWVRVPVQGRDPDELRLLVLPRVSMPGVLGIEMGLAWSTTPAGWAPTPEILARVVEGSAAAAKLAQQVPGARAVPGRRSDERVVRLLPSAPKRSAAMALVRALGDALTDRRVAVEGWSGEDRRVASPGARLGVAAAAAA
jgi:hypothetical protein